MPVPPTLQTIADAAHVSRMTVSRSLRNDPSIPPATRSRIRAIAEQLGYKPNPLVSALMTTVRARQPHTTTTVLAYLTTYAHNSDFGKFDYLRLMKQGATQRAEELGFRLEEFNLPSLGVTLRRLTQILETRGIRGMLIAPMPQSGRLAMDFTHFSAAAIGSSLLRPDLHRAQSHTSRNLSLALRTLRRMGYRRMGLVLDQLGETRTEHLLSSLMLHFQTTHPKQYHVPTLVIPMIERPSVLEWVAEHRPEVILGFDFAIPWWLRELQGERPKFVNLNWGARDGSDYGIDQEVDRIAAAGIDLIVEQLFTNSSGIPSHPKTVMRPGRWVESPSSTPSESFT